MKHLKLMFVMLFLLSVQAKALTVNELDHFFCGFETEEEYNIWTQVNTNGVDDYDFNKWWWDAGHQAAIYHPWMGQADDWIISPAVSLSGEKKMAIKVKMWLDPYNIQDRMQFTIGDGLTAESQSTILLDETYSAGNYYLVIPIPEDTPAGTYHFGIHALAPGWGGPDYVQSFEVVENVNSSLEITLKNKETQTAISNATVALTGAYYEKTEAATSDAGSCAFENLSNGTYTIDVTADGFIPITGQEVVISGEDNMSVTIELEQVFFSVISGKVVDESGNPEKGVIIQLDGEDIDYETVTDENGAYVIEEVRRPREYQMSVSKDFKISYHETLSVNLDEETKQIDDIVLKDYVSAPIINAEPTGRGMFVSWIMPMEDSDFAKDCGRYEGIYTIENPVYATMGTLFREPMRVTSLSWMAVDVADELVDVYVYVLGSDGSLPSKPVYSATGVPTRNYKDGEDFVWPEHVLPQPIDAPYGCIVAIGHKEKLSIVLDYLNNSDTSLTTGLPDDGWTVCRLSNFFIRAKGNPLRSDVTFADDAALRNVRCLSADMQKVAPKTNTPANFSYNLWRFENSEKDNQEAWTSIASGAKSMYFIDNDFLTLKQGVYRYAIQTAYPDGRTSEIAYSQNIDHKMLTSLDVAVTTSSAIDFSEGAEIKAVNAEDETLTYVATVKDNKATLANIRKGVYHVTATKQGFKTAAIDLDLTESNSYYTIFDLELQALAPFNLKAQQAEDSNDVTVEWNGDDGISEDCETMEDFAVNPTGRCEWTYADVDGGATYGVKQCERSPYPNMFAPMAYMAFNPSATTPALLEYLQPHSGDKMLVSVGLQDGMSRNDDYLFSPELSFDTDFILEFYAASGFYASLGNEEFMVGYTTGEAKAENVIWLTEAPETVGAIWTKFEYGMPKDARHAVIRCVSNQHMFFMLDDIFIGRREAETFAMTTFNVYLDDEQVGNTATKSMTFNNLTEGKHLVKVQTVYPMRENDKTFSDFTELMFTVNSVSGVTDTKVVETLYTYNNGIIVPGEKTAGIDMFDIQGRLCASCKAGETISTEGMGTGVYLIRVSHDGQVTFDKILVK